MPIKDKLSKLFSSNKNKNSQSNDSDDSKETPDEKSAKKAFVDKVKSINVQKTELTSIPDAIAGAISLADQCVKACDDYFAKRKHAAEQTALKSDAIQKYLQKGQVSNYVYVSALYDSFLYLASLDKGANPKNFLKNLNSLLEFMPGKLESKGWRRIYQKLRKSKLYLWNDSELQGALSSICGFLKECEKFVSEEDKRKKEEEDKRKKEEEDKRKKEEENKRKKEEEDKRKKEVEDKRKKEVEDKTTRTKNTRIYKKGKHEKLIKELITKHL